MSKKTTSNAPATEAIEPADVRLFEISDDVVVFAEGLGIDLVGTVEDRADRAAQHMNRSQRHMLASGLLLASIKADCDHGTFRGLIEERGFEPRAAQRAMQYAEFILSRPDAERQLLIGMPKSKVLALAGADGAVIEQLLTDGGERIEGLSVRALMDELRDAKAGSVDLATQRDTAEAEADALRQQLAQRTERADKVPLVVAELRAEIAAHAKTAQLSIAAFHSLGMDVVSLGAAGAHGLHGAYRYLRDFIARQAIPTQATEEFLDGWLETYNLPRKAASAAIGVANGSGVSSSILPAGTLLQAADGRQFRVTSDSVVSGSLVSAPFVALVPGVAGNLSESTALQLVSPVTGVDSTFNVPMGASGGADSEKDEDAAYRLQQRLASEPMGGSPADYARWALSVPGITRAWGVRNPAGPTSAGVIIMADGNAGGGLPTDVQRAQVSDYIRDPHRGPPDELFVIVPTPVVVNWVIHLAPDTAAIRAAVIAALQDVFFREAAPGGAIPHSHCTEVISAVVGEYNHAVSTPAIVSGGFFTVDGPYKLLMLGTVNYS